MGLAAVESGHTKPTRNTPMKPNQLPVMLAIVMLASCGSGGNKSGTTNTATSEPVVNAPPTQIAKAALSILIPQAIADEAPMGTIYIVKVSGKSSIATKQFPADKNTLTLDGLEPGEYTIELTAKNGDATIALGSLTATVSADKPVTSAEVPLKYLRGSLLLKPVTAQGHPTMELIRGKYTATARVSGCLP